MVGLSCLGDRLRPRGLVERIGEILGLEADTAAMAVADIVLTDFALQEVTGVELHTGAIGKDSHCSAGKGVCQNGAGVDGRIEIVVVALLESQGIIAFVNISADGLCSAEIHGGAVYRAVFSGGDGLGIGNGEETGRHLQ